MRLTTWNVQGRAGPDVGALAHELRSLGSHAVVLQEVQRGQARRLAAELGWGLAWRWKHWPVVVRAEGLAVLGPAVTSVRTQVLAHRWRFWSSRRRIAVAARVTTADGFLAVVDVHLGSGVDDEERARQAALAVDLDGDVVAGDLNTAPGSPVLGTFEAAGFRDAWAGTGEGPGRTNWGRSLRHQPPTRRLDYVLVGPRWRVVDARVATHGSPGFEAFGALSDHLPVTVALERVGVSGDRG